MSYQVIVRPAAEKFILRLSESPYRAIIGCLRSLEEEPRPPYVKKLSGTSFWRLRIRDFRIVYSIDDTERVVRVVRIARRSENT